ETPPNRRNHAYASTTWSRPLCPLCSVSSVLFLCVLGCLYSFEEARAAVFPHSVPVEAAAVHRDVDARRQRLHERQRAAEIEEAVRAAERVGDHRAREDDGFRRA